MSLLYQKSELNYASAEHLQSNYYYCSVVHCAYYSSLQLMRHVLFNKAGKTEAQIREESSKDPDNKGFHNYMINQTANYLHSKNNKGTLLFIKHMNSLKKLRVQSDYEDVNIDVDKGKNSLILSGEINKILKSAI